MLQARSHSKSSSQYTVSRLNLVDLAGSERLSKTKVRQQHSANINALYSIIYNKLNKVQYLTKRHVQYTSSCSEQKRMPVAFCVISTAISNCPITSSV